VSRIRLSFARRQPVSVPSRVSRENQCRIIVTLRDRRRETLEDDWRIEEDPFVRSRIRRISEERKLLPIMDINSLLSPSDSPAGTPTPQPAPALPSPSAMRSPGKRTRRQMPSRTPSGLSQQITSSPQPHQTLLQQRIPSPGYAHITNGTRPVHSAMSTPQQTGSPRDARMTPPNPMYRQASTPGMDTLAGRCSVHWKGIVKEERRWSRTSLKMWNGSF
jgi:hypothetical protein